MSLGEDRGVELQRFGGGDDTERPLGRSIMRGLAGRCPRCATGRLFKAFLKPVDRCEACGEDLHHQRADDLPPYIVILILGHVLVGGFMLTDLIYPASEWLHLAIWAPIGVLTAIAALQPVKGGVIGLQWALRMHGFGGHDDTPESFDEGSGT
ncbi:DUF983 domain-containing protein [Rhizobium halophytocola]|uniref:Uncharacterized protein (DUF983 family) n=1 Tax=Rhizobium halophytocola TaxID=735519 RepID=A0ABS4DY18_9HYPH|nr:DUF983 domain-containing protein [Rhizobium halophytocola]MBP1850591.1 uncharacterized protein (DUF983 family) [Rhizobium halophytocola]